MKAEQRVSGKLLAGVAKVDITDESAGPVDGPLYAKALILRDDSTATTLVMITVDAVAIAEIGRLRNEYLGNVRAQLAERLQVDPASVLVNASHCHGSVCADVEERTVRVVEMAFENLVPVTVEVGTGHEDRIMENRRFRLKNGCEADARRAYSLPPDGEIAGVGPVDPEIGILRLQRGDGRALAVVYNFACHPIKGVPSGANTADLAGFACEAVESSTDAVAFFLQGCAGDINPACYKDVENPPNAEILGSMLGLSVLQGLKTLRPSVGASLKIVRRIVELPRADLQPHIERLEAEQMRLLGSLRATDINFKTFLHLSARQAVSPEFPSFYAYRYLHEKQQGKDGLAKLDARNRKSLEQYESNIHTMEEMTRLQANLALLKMHHAQNLAAGGKPLCVEMLGVRIGDFFLVTFPGELSVEIGLGIKRRSPHKLTFVAGITNGYIYYSPTAKQLENRGGAQEDSDCLLDAGWQDIFETTVAELLEKL